MPTIEELTTLLWTTAIDNQDYQGLANRLFGMWSFAISMDKIDLELIQDLDFLGDIAYTLKKLNK